MTTVWDSRSESKAAEESTHQTWLVGDTLTLARYDAVTGFDADSGKERWQFSPPRGTDIYAASKTTDSARALVAHTGMTGAASGRCAVVTALDLTDGRELWNTTLAISGGTADRSDALATGGGLGVVLDAGTGTDTTTVRAFDLLTGSERWTAAVPKGCAPARTAVAPKQVVAVLACGEEVKLAAFDPADGKERWTTPLDTRNGVATGSSVTITATDPIVLRVDEGDRGIEAFLTFGPGGRPGARVQVTGDDYGSIGPDTVVSDKRLFAVTDGGPWGRLVAFDLTSGDELAAEADIPARRVDEVLAVTDIEGVAEREVGTYSPCTRRRLGLATALLGDPRVLVLDEPAGGLDPQGVRRLRTLLRRLADQDAPCCCRAVP
ncbi:Outer membrane protein assembly factor BamB [Streptomyces fumanus]